MSEFPVEGGENMHTAMENFQKKNLVTGRTHHVTHHPQVTTTSSQVIISNSDFCCLSFFDYQIFARASRMLRFFEK